MKTGKVLHQLFLWVPVNWEQLKNQGRLQNIPYNCVLKYAQAVKQKVWTEAENGERDWGQACEAHTLRACETLQLH